MVDLCGAFGTIGLGRDYTAAFAVSAATDADDMSAYSTTSPLAGVRRDNAITYSSPDMRGFSVKLQMAPGKTTREAAVCSAGFCALADSEVKTASSGFNVAYKTGGLYAGFGYETDKATNVIGDSFVKNTGWVAGTSYDFGNFKLLGNYVNHKTTATVFDASGLKASEWNIGAVVPFGAFSMVGSVGKAKAKIDDVSTKGSAEWLLGVNYALSKRTSVFARAGKNISLAASAGSVEITAAKRTAVGLTHLF